MRENWDNACICITVFELIPTNKHVFLLDLVGEFITIFSLDSEREFKRFSIGFRINFSKLGGYIDTWFWEITEIWTFCIFIIITYLLIKFLIDSLAELSIDTIWHIHVGNTWMKSKTSCLGDSSFLANLVLNSPEIPRSFVKSLKLSELFSWLDALFIIWPKFDCGWKFIICIWKMNKERNCHVFNQTLRF